MRRVILLAGTLAISGCGREDQPAWPKEPSRGAERHFEWILDDGAVEGMDNFAFSPSITLDWQGRALTLDCVFVMDAGTYTLTYDLDVDGDPQSRMFPPEAPAGETLLSTANGWIEHGRAFVTAEDDLTRPDQYEINYIGIRPTSWWAQVTDGKNLRIAVPRDDNLTWILPVANLADLRDPFEAACRRQQEKM